MYYKQNKKGKNHNNIISLSISHKRKLAFNLLLILFFFFYSLGISLASHLDLPKDSNGWTIFTPSPDSRIIYVDPVSGNNNTGAVYSVGSDEVGADPFNPVGQISAFATFAVAIENARYGFPDYVLLKRGTTLRENTGGVSTGAYTKLRSGRSITEPSLFGTYGNGAPPVVEIGPEGIGLYAHGSLSYIAVSGIDFYAYARDPENISFATTGGATGVLWLSSGSKNVTGRLIEGCRFRFFKDGMNIAVTDADASLGASIDGLTIRRCSVLDSYSEHQGHSQGIYVKNITSLVLEENIFDHNGWYSQAGSGGIGEATIFNHNTYLSDVTTTVAQRNISLRASSGGIKFANYNDFPRTATVDNNLIVDGEVAINAWGDITDDSRYHLTITNNVATNIGRSKPTNRPISWGMEITDVDHGIVQYNLFMNQLDDTLIESVGIQIKGYMRDTTIHGNVLYNLHKASGFRLWSTGGDPYDPFGVTFSSNIVQNPVSAGHLASSLYYHPSGLVSFSNNKYYSGNPDGQRFMILNQKKTDAQWAVETGDTSTVEQVAFTDPTRSIETYMQFIGEGSTIDDFM